jgi:hypothetical protein
MRRLTLILVALFCVGTLGACGGHPARAKKRDVRKTADEADQDLSEKLEAEDK